MTTGKTKALTRWTFVGSLRDPLKIWVLSHGSHNQSLSDTPALSESNSDSDKVLQGSSWPSPTASLLHPLLLPSSHPLNSSHPCLGCCANTPGSCLAASAQGLLITECFPDPLSLVNPHHSLSSHHSSPPAIGFPHVFIVCWSQKAYNFTIFCLQLFTNSKNHVCFLKPKG